MGSRNLGHPSCLSPHGLCCVSCCCSVVSSLLQAGVVCVSPSYLVDWLAQPWQGLEQHYLFGSSPQDGSELQQLEAGRDQEGQAQRSMSF